MTKIALPAVGNQFSTHFGGAEKFIVFEVDEGKQKIISSKEEFPPLHATGTYPEFLKSLNVDIVLASGMGPRAVSMLESSQIKVVLGIQNLTDPTRIVMDFLEGKIEATGESCHDHSYHDCHK